jgi:hypothetical protein
MRKIFFALLILVSSCSNSSEEADDLLVYFEQPEEADDLLDYIEQLVQETNTYKELDWESSKQANIPEGFSMVAIAGCPFCRERIQHLNDLSKKNKHISFQVLLLSWEDKSFKYYQSQLSSEIELVVSNKGSELSELVGGSYPSFIFKGNNKIIRWSNSSWGVKQDKSINMVLHNNYFECSNPVNNILTSLSQSKQGIFFYPNGSGEILWESIVDGRKKTSTAPMKWYIDNNLITVNFVFSNEYGRQESKSLKFIFNKDEKQRLTEKSEDDIYIKTSSYKTGVLF